MRKIIALALLFVLSFVNFGQTITLQTQPAKPTAQKVKKPTSKTKKRTAKIKKRTPSKTKKTTVAKTKTADKPEITTIPAKTADGKDVTLKSNGTWAYKKPEPTPKPSPIAKPSPTPKPKITAIATPTPKPKIIAITTLTPAIKPNPSPVAKSTPTPKTKAFIESKTCDLTLKDSPQIRGLKLGMPRAEADEIIPDDRVTIVNSSDIISYPQFSNARGFETVYQISAEFLEINSRCSRSFMTPTT